MKGAQAMNKTARLTPAGCVFSAAFASYSSMAACLCRIEFSWIAAALSAAAAIGASLLYDEEKGCFGARLVFAGAGAVGSAVSVNSLAITLDGVSGIGYPVALCACVAAAVVFGSTLCAAVGRIAFLAALPCAAAAAILFASPDKSAALNRDSLIPVVLCPVISAALASYTRTEKNDGARKDAAHRAAASAAGVVVGAIFYAAVGANVGQNVFTVYFILCARLVGAGAFAAVAAESLVLRHASGS